MTCFDRMRLVAGAIALALLSVCWVIVSVVMIEAAKVSPVHEPRGMYPEIPQCDKELWLRITEGCDVSTTE